MKQAILILLPLLLIAAPALAQTESSVVNHIFYVGDSNKLESLEKVEVEMKSKSRLAGFGGSTSAYMMAGSSSSVQLIKQRPEFAINLAGMMDPSQMIRLYRFDKKDNAREYIVSKMGAMGKNSSTNTEGIRFSVRKNDKGVFFLLPDEPLAAGEYAFINMMMMSGGGGRGTMPTYTAFAFSIH